MEDGLVHSFRDDWQRFNSITCADASWLDTRNAEVDSSSCLDIPHSISRRRLVVRFVVLGSIREIGSAGTVDDDELFHIYEQPSN